MARGYRRCPNGLYVLHDGSLHRQIAQAVILTIGEAVAFRGDRVSSLISV